MPEDITDTKDQRSRKGAFYAILNRINLNKDFFLTAWNLQPRCMAVFGSKVEEIFLLMHRARREIEVAAHMLLSAQPGMAQEMRDQLEHDIWDMGTYEGEKDRVGQKLTAFRVQTESLCRPVIDREYNAGSIRRRKSRKSLVRTGVS
jgi:hypothetical protein